MTNDALAIWRAGVDAVRGKQVVHDHVRVDERCLKFGPLEFDLDDIDRIVVVGAGKAGASMSLGLESALGGDVLQRCQVNGWVNVPEGCQHVLNKIYLHPARPPSRNEPTEAGAVGARRILDLVTACGPRDLCIGLFSGGGSALLPLPIEGVTLDEKIHVTRHLSAAGANIWQLNIVRKRLSRIKGGGLARACRAGNLVSLIISDVIGDPLEVIASGPTVTGNEVSDMDPSPDVVARQFGLQEIVSAGTWEILTKHPSRTIAEPICGVHNQVIANNAMAVDAAARKAREFGYACEILPTEPADCSAETVGRDLARRCILLSRSNSPSTCLVSGGEPIVRLVSANRRGKGGRNQQVALAAFIELVESGDCRPEDLDRIAILSGGTDGEDGPTEAAGAIVDAKAMAPWRLTGDRRINPREYLDRNDAHTFFSALDCLLVTGPTNTNVCDLRVAIVSSR